MRQAGTKLDDGKIDFRYDSNTLPTASPGQPIPRGTRMECYTSSNVPQSVIAKLRYQGGGKTITFVISNGVPCFLDSRVYSNAYNSTGTATAVWVCVPIDAPVGGPPSRAVGSGASGMATPGSLSNSTSTALGQYLGIAAALTPQTSGKVVVTFTAQVPFGANSGLIIRALDIYYGTGTAPSNGGTVPGTGTAMGTAGQAVQTGTVVGAEALTVAIVLQAVVTGLTVGTAYWFDVAANNNNAVAIAWARITVTMAEIP